MREQYDYWADFPPVHVMVRAYLGYKGRTRADDTLAELMAFAGTPGVKKVKISDLPDWAKPKWPMNAN